jgi:protein-S-isoprenylcysteine O-methyltransferase Ste14
MFPILIATYVRLAHREEREVEAELGDQWRAYAASTPRFVPRLHQQESIDEHHRAHI